MVIVYSRRIARNSWTYLPPTKTYARFECSFLKLVTRTRFLNFELNFADLKAHPMKQVKLFRQALALQCLVSSLLLS